MDDDIAVRLLYLFEELNRMGTTVMIATHNQGLIDRFKHPVFHLEDGELSAVEDIPPVEEEENPFFVNEMQQVQTGGEND